MVKRQARRGGVARVPAPSRRPGPSGERPAHQDALPAYSRQKQKHGRPAVPPKSETSLGRRAAHLARGEVRSGAFLAARPSAGVSD